MGQKKKNKMIIINFCLLFFHYNLAGTGLKYY